MSDEGGSFLDLLDIEGGLVLPTDPRAAREMLVGLVRGAIERHWPGWGVRARVEADPTPLAPASWSVIVTFVGVDWHRRLLPDGRGVLWALVPDPPHPGQLKRVEVPDPAGDGPLAPTPPPAGRGRKVRLPALDAEELEVLLHALFVRGVEIHDYDHNAAYLERVLRRAVEESRRDS